MDYISKIKDMIMNNTYHDNMGYNNTGLLNYNLKINPCMSDDDMNSLESEYGIALPKEYREYIINVGDGGNQPGTGMLTAEQSLALISGRNVYGGKIEYGDLTKYYCSLNLSGSDNLLNCYVETFGESEWMYHLYECHCDVNSIKI